mmetsp:Transcript_49349/g.117628  ORF Transcript_49349/g.117628 Transcript_49349/m.117628 type:complete len:280 (-) Transcript_49349:744-1583(-)
MLKVALVLLGRLAILGGGHAAGHSRIALPRVHQAHFHGNGQVTRVDVLDVHLWCSGVLGVERDGCRLAVHLIAIVILPETENLVAAIGLEATDRHVMHGAIVRERRRQTLRHVKLVHNVLEPGVKRSGIGFNLADSHPEGSRQISELGHTAPHADPTALDGCAAWPYMVAGGVCNDCTKRVGLAASGCTHENRPISRLLWAAIRWHHQSDGPDAVEQVTEINSEVRCIHVVLPARRGANVNRIVRRAVLTKGIVAPSSIHCLLCEPAKGNRGGLDVPAL